MRLERSKTKLFCKTHPCLYPDTLVSRNVQGQAKVLWLLFITPPSPQCRHSLEVWFIYLYVICYNFCFSWNGCKNKLLLWCFREQYSLLISRHLRLENFKCFTLSIWCVWWEGMETDLAANIWQISYHTIWILTFL